MKRIAIFLCLLCLVGCDPTWKLLRPDAPYQWMPGRGGKIPVGHLEEKGVFLDFTGQLTYYGTLSITGAFEVRVTNNNDYSLKISEKNVLLKIDENEKFPFVPKLSKSKDPEIPFFEGKFRDGTFIVFKEMAIKPKETVLISLLFGENFPSVPKESLSIIFDDLADRKHSDRMRLNIRFHM